jgi:hypothetical protein
VAIGKGLTIIELVTVVSPQAFPAVTLMEKVPAELYVIDPGVGKVDEEGVPLVKAHK